MPADPREPLHLQTSEFIISFDEEDDEITVDVVQLDHDGTTPTE